MATSIEIEIIKNNPIKNEYLNALATSKDNVPAIFSTATTETESMLSFLSIIQTELAARRLPSRIKNGTLANDIWTLYGLVDANTVKVVSAAPFVEKVLNSIQCGEGEGEFWDNVSDLVSLIRPTTPTIALNKAIVDDTPIRPNSASQLGNEQTHELIDQRIIEELAGRIYYDTKNFITNFIDGKNWSNQTWDIYKESKAQYRDGCWIDFPNPSVETEFYRWFMKFQGTVLHTLDRQYVTSNEKVLKGSEAKRKLDIFLTSEDASAKKEYEWSKVLVIGEHKSNPEMDRASATLIQLAGYAREVFGSQPGRRFVPGFTICGSLMRLWMFDRSGSYSSEKFDIHKEPEKFVRVISGYALMSDSELGLNIFVRSDDIGRYIVARDTKIYLEEKPIASQKAIVCRGTTCYRGRESDSSDYKYVVKFAWSSDQRLREGRLLKLAKKREVKGIAEWFHDEQVIIDGEPDTISHLRRNMKFGALEKPSGKASWLESLESNRHPSRKSLFYKSKSKPSTDRSIGRRISTSTTQVSSGQKRKRDEGYDARHDRMKRSKSDDGEITEGHEDKSDMHHSIEEAEVDSLVGQETEAYGNRIHYCIVTLGAGRPLHTYRSVKELLVVFRDAIVGHKSLFDDGKILHRDVSENNIIIVDSATKEGSEGRMIDLDLAKELNSKPSGASYRTGTMQFMAIEVLQGKGHTYRHDLESFFYVFIWMCIRYGHEDVHPPSDKPKPTNQKSLKSSNPKILHYWYTGDYNQIANTKRGHIVGFNDITAEFSPQFTCLKGLAEELKSVLFPMKGSLFTGTYRVSNIMYNGMIEAFEKAIEGMEGV
ncbi:hypothetical protein EAF04_008947 [Stromatinia cepivora]|nr:hypothetical protein EAF04_008947 [Stromatinia cepivora]